MATGRLDACTGDCRGICKGPVTITKGMVCSPCHRADNVHVTAVTYCKDCKEFFCEPCVSFHNRLKVMKGHTLVGNGRLTLIKPGTLKGQTVLKCVDHDVAIERYCFTHKELGCDICMALKHSGCNVLDHIPYNNGEITTDIIENEQKMRRRRKFNKQNSLTFKPLKETDSSTVTLDLTPKNKDEHVNEDLKVVTDFKRRLDALIEKLELKNSKERADHFLCKIYGSCLLPNGKVLITDYINLKLKRLYENKLVDFITFPNYPFGVSQIAENNEAVVALAGHVLQVVSLGKKMALTRTINTPGHQCRGVVYHSGTVYATDNIEGKLHAYEYSSGKHLRTYNKDSFGVKIFSNPQHITIDTLGENIYVADLDKGLVILTLDGEVILPEFSHPEVVGCQGVCLDAGTYLFLAGYESGTVVQLDRSGRYICTIVHKSRELDRPESVLYDPNKSSLMLTMADTVKVFTLHTDE